MSFPRSSGILLHPTSLPGPHGSGDLGPAAYHFVDWLVGARQRLWQMLPLGGIGPGNSPYMSSSAFAGNPLLIDLAGLRERGWLSDADLLELPAFEEQRLRFDLVYPWRMERLRRAEKGFQASASDAEQRAFADFCAQHAAWLDDYALFMSLAEALQWRDWCDWPGGLGRREPAALETARAQYAHDVRFWKFCQWVFFAQWQRLRAYANERGVRIVGDAPIFIAYMSAEAWARQELFDLDEQGRAVVVAGVPPDFFSTEGQRWGNPLYRWSAHAAEGYAWWIARIRHCAEMVDIVRIDHFRGFAGYWEVPAVEPNAVKGRWLPGPGPALFEAIRRALGTLPIIAEDLGIITPDVIALRDDFALPGMRILQFGFGEGRPDDHSNPFLPHNYVRNTVVYTGTHDNDTTQGWWASATPACRAHVRGYLGLHEADDALIHWSLIRAATASIADTAIIPMQDVLGLPTEHRMNLPGERSGYWEWRFAWSQVQPGHGAQLAELALLYGRAP